jgi:hypothetical protein
VTTTTTTTTDQEEAMHRSTPIRKTLALVAAAAAAAALALGAAGRADAAQITSATFHCSYGYVSANPPVVSGQQGQYAYWYPVVYRYLGAAGWEVYATPGMFYAGRLGMSFDWLSTSDNRPFNGPVQVAPGYYYAVIHYVWDNGWTHALAKDNEFYNWYCKV